MLLRRAFSWFPRPITLKKNKVILFPGTTWIVVFYIEMVQFGSFWSSEKFWLHIRPNFKGKLGLSQTFMSAHKMSVFIPNIQFYYTFESPLSTRLGAD